MKEGLSLVRLRSRQFGFGRASAACTAMQGVAAVIYEASFFRLDVLGYAQHVKTSMLRG